ncbi:hypothetical protein FACS1894188_12700 [Clostridia bacterium]|nr:hypothetical protein FACS1894188_12700 [Clostridia bacterium]
MKSIKQKMIIGVLLICVVGIGINTAVAYDIARTMIYEEAVDGKQKFVNAESADIDGWIAENKAVLDTLARTFETLPSDTRDRDALRRLFAFQTQGHGQIKDIYAGFSDDMSVFGLSTTDRSSYYPTTRPWYIQAMEHKGQIIVTGPYESATTTGTLVTIARYAGQQDGYDCVLGLDIYISAIADAVTDMALADGAYVYIAGVNGEIIAESAASARGVRDGVKREVFIGNIPSTRWTYVYAVPEKVITAPVHKLLAGVLLILSVVVFVVCVFAWQFITRIIVTPLRAVSSASDKIADGIIDFPLQSNSRDEIGTLIRDFARVQ